MTLIPLVAALDPALVSRGVAATRPAADDREQPAALAAVPALAEAPVIHLGELTSDPYFAVTADPYTSMQAALHPYSGLRWGVRYGATADIARTMWAPAARRLDEIAASLPGQHGIDRLRSIGIGWVIALAPVHAPGLELATVVRGSGRPEVFVYRIDPPPVAFAREETTGQQLRWREIAPHRISIDLEGIEGAAVVITRNALPGWTARGDGRLLPVEATAEGLLRIEPPAGTTLVELTYEPPGLRLGLGLGIAGLIVSIVIATRGGQARRRREGP